MGNRQGADTRDTGQLQEQTGNRHGKFNRQGTDERCLLLASAGTWEQTGNRQRPPLRNEPATQPPSRRAYPRALREAANASKPHAAPGRGRVGRTPPRCAPVRRRAGAGGLWPSGRRTHAPRAHAGRGRSASTPASAHARKQGIATPLSGTRHCCYLRTCTAHMTHRHTLLSFIQASVCVTHGSSVSGSGHLVQHVLRTPTIFKQEAQQPKASQIQSQLYPRQQLPSSLILMCRARGGVSTNCDKGT